MMARMRAAAALLCACALMASAGRIAPRWRDRAIHIDSRMAAPRWAHARAPAARRQRAGVPRVLPEIFRRPRLPAVRRALGRQRRPGRCVRELQPVARAARARRASDDILQMYCKGHEGLLKQYTEARTTDVPIARGGHVLQGIHRPVRLDASRRRAAAVQPDGPVDSERPEIPGARAAVRRLLHGRGSRGAQLRPVHKLIRSMQNGSRGPMLRKATPIDWVGDPFDVKGFDALARRIDLRRSSSRTTRNTATSPAITS